MKGSRKLVSGVLSTVLALGGASAVRPEKGVKAREKDKSQRSVLRPWSTKGIVGVIVGTGVIGTSSYFVGKSRGASEKNDQNEKSIGAMYGLENGIDMSELKGFLSFVNPQRAKRLDIQVNKDEVIVKMPGSGESSDYIDNKGNCYRDFEVKFTHNNEDGCYFSDRLYAKVVLSTNGVSWSMPVSCYFKIPKCGESSYKDNKYGDDLADCASFLYNLLGCFLELEFVYNLGVRKTHDKNSFCRQFVQNLAKNYIGDVINKVDSKVVGEIINKAAAG